MIIQQSYDDKILKNGGEYRNIKFVDTCVVNSFIHCVFWAYIKSESLKNFVDQVMYPSVFCIITKLQKEGVTKKLQQVKGKLLWSLYKERKVNEETICCKDNVLVVIDKLFEAVPSLIQELRCLRHKKITEFIYTYITIDKQYNFYNLNKALDETLEEVKNRKLDCCNETENHIVCSLKMQPVLWVDTSEMKWDIGDRIPTSIQVKSQSFQVQAFINKEKHTTNHVVAYCKRSFDADWNIFDDTLSSLSLGKDKSLFQPIAILYTNETT